MPKTYSGDWTELSRPQLVGACRDLFARNGELLNKLAAAEAERLSKSCAFFVEQEQRKHHLWREADDRARRAEAQVEKIQMQLRAALGVPGDTATMLDLFARYDEACKAMAADRDAAEQERAALRARVAELEAERNKWQYAYNAVSDAIPWDDVRAVLDEAASDIPPQITWERAEVYERLEHWYTWFAPQEPPHAP